LLVACDLPNELSDLGRRGLPDVNALANLRDGGAPVA